MNQAFILRKVLNGYLLEPLTFVNGEINQAMQTATPDERRLVLNELNQLYYWLQEEFEPKKPDEKAM